MISCKPQSHIWGVFGMETEVLFCGDKYQSLSCCPQGMGLGSGCSWQQQQPLFCPIQPGQGMPAPGLIPNPLWQCLQQNQAKKLPVDTRVCKHEQSSKD